MKNHEITLNHKIREHWEIMCHKHIILSYIATCNYKTKYYDWIDNANS